MLTATTRKRRASTPLDVGRPSASSRQARLMGSANETLLRSLEGALSGCLQTDVKAELKHQGLTTAAGFRREIPTPACLVSFRLHPRTDRMILHVDCVTALNMLEMLLGGKESSPPEPRELTEIEWSLLEEVIRVIVRSLGEAWRVYYAVEFEVESLGSDPAFLNLPDTGQPLSKLSIGIHWGDPESRREGGFHLALPQSFFDLPADSVASQELAAIPVQADLNRNLDLLQEAGVRLEVTLQGPTLAFEDLLDLKIGQVVVFDYPLNKPLRGTVNGAAPMTGQIVSAKQKRAFQIERLPVRATS